ncbi:MAG TPA: DUF4157 domain-containing protein [Anaerolineaceae bacterium]|nr:DUF4157 domain-containing protein [Anaerolineaceae bacterium]
MIGAKEIVKEHHHSSEKHSQQPSSGEKQTDVQQTLSSPQTASPEGILQLQRAAGNAAVGSLLNGQQNATRPGAALDRSLTQNIHSASSRGAALPPVLRQDLEHNFSANFGSVRIHADGQADNLSRQLQARAFTVGRDIFFRQGAYAPHTTRGKQTLRHELTHVLQQGGRSASHLRLGPENDSHEREAERASRSDAAPAATPSTAAAGSVQCIRWWPWEHGRKIKSLGGGSANKVYRVQHQSGHVGYMKPDTANDPQMGARSVLSSDINDSLGLDSLSHEDFVNYGKGKVGAESSEVPGTTVTDNRFDTEITKKEYDLGAKMDPGKYKVKKTGLFSRKYYKVSGTQFNTHDFTRPQTQQDLANLQLQDAITGQNDRHGGNIRIDPATGRAKGYDNDLVDIGHDTTLQKMKNLHKPTDGTPFTNEMRAKRDAARQMAEAHIDSTWGKKVGLPSHIDEASATRLQGMKSRAFIADLQRRNPENMRRMTPEQIEELRQRYSVVRRYAKRGLAGGPKGPTIVRGGTGGWNQQTYDAQVGQYAGKQGFDYHSYLQRSVHNYNFVQEQGGRTQQGDELMMLDNPHGAHLPGPQPAKQPPQEAPKPPATTVAPPTVAPTTVAPPTVTPPVQKPPESAPTALPPAVDVPKMHPQMGVPDRGNVRLNRLRAYYEELAKQQH